MADPCFNCSLKTAAFIYSSVDIVISLVAALFYTTKIIEIKSYNETSGTYFNYFTGNEHLSRREHFDISVYYYFSLSLFILTALVSILLVLFGILKNRPLGIVWTVLTSIFTLLYAVILALFNPRIVPILVVLCISYICYKICEIFVVSYLIDDLVERPIRIVELDDPYVYDEPYIYEPWTPHYYGYPPGYEYTTITIKKHKKKNSDDGKEQQQQKKSEDEPKLED